MTVVFRLGITDAWLRLSLAGWSGVGMTSKLKSPFGGVPAATSAAERKYFPAVKLLNTAEYGGAEVNVTNTAPWRSSTNAMFVVPAGLAGVAIIATFVIVAPLASAIAPLSLTPEKEIPWAPVLPGVPTISA